MASNLKEQPKMPPANKTQAKPAAVRARRAEPAPKSNGMAAGDAVVFVNIAIDKRARAGLNKLVAAMEVTSQRQVLEQLIADELHRRKMRLPRAA
jgi:hypothetical protein